MLRSIAGVVVGYIAMGLVVFIAMVAGYEIMGGDWAFKPGVYDVTGGWIALMLASGLAAAVAGGAVCGLLSRHSKKAAIALTAVVVVLGALTVIGQILAPESAEMDLVRTEAPPVLEAAGVARQPTWVMLANIAIGVAGVMLGAGLVRPKHGGKADAGSGGGAD
jgi:hypothetical protein